MEVFVVKAVKGEGLEMVEGADDPNHTVEVAGIGFGVEALMDAGYVAASVASEYTCVLGRRAVSATHQCLGVDCMAWRVGPVAYDAPDRAFGYCGLAGGL